MTKSELKHEVLQLPVEERLELVEVIWESLDRSTGEPPLHDWQRRILDERIDEDEQDPDAGAPWHEVKQRILESL